MPDAASTLSRDAAQVVAELLVAHLVRAPVEIAVDADLVALRGRARHEAGMAARDPAQDEDGGAVPALPQHLEKAEEALLHARDERVPPPRIGVVPVAADVEPVLQVDGEHPRRASGVRRGVMRGSDTSGELYA